MGAIALAGTLLGANSTGAAAATPTLQQVRHSTASTSVAFETNQGQYAPEVAYAARTFAGTLFVTHDGRIVHSLAGKSAQTNGSQTTAVSQPPRKPADRGSGWTLVESLDGAAPLAPTGFDQRVTRISRFQGSDRSQWQTGIASFDRVQLGEAWPGVSVELAARGSNVEKLFTVAPGADAQAIGMVINGAHGLRLSDDGALVAFTGNGDIAFTAPIAFQQIDGRRHDVPVRYALEPGNRYGFETGAYDRSQPLVIDPLLRATYVGGNDSDNAVALAVDPSGDVFVAGFTLSSPFPGTAGGAQAVHAASTDTFVMRLSADLGTVVQATYLGGSSNELAYGITLDAGGNVFIAGVTSSLDLPGTALGAQPVLGGDQDIFVARLSNDLQTLAQTTYLGGSNIEEAGGIVVDSAGSVYVAGHTQSANVPGTGGGAQSAYGGGPWDGMIARLSNDLRTLHQATYLGGAAEDQLDAIALDSSNNVIVAGLSVSPNFPQAAGGAQPANNGGAGDGVVARLSSNLQTLVQATYFGGSGFDRLSAVAIDVAGNIFAGGTTGSNDLSHTTGAAQSALVGGSDGFVVRLAPDLLSVARATYFGGGSFDAINSLQLASGGALFVAGTTRSADLPGTTGGVQATAPAGITDGFVARFAPYLLTMEPASYFGGSDGDGISALMLDGAGNVLVTGYTDSTNLPGTAASAQPVSGGARDGFIARMTPNLLAAYTVAATAGANGSATPTSQDVTHGLTAAITVTPNAGHVIGTVAGCGAGTLVGDTYTTPAVTAPCTITANFLELQTVMPPAAPPFSAGGAIVLPPNASSGLPVSYASTTPAVCTVAGNTVTMVAAGTCTITATQAGNGVYAPLATSFALVLLAAPVGVAPIPTLSEWGLLLMSLLAAVLGMRAVGRRNRSLSN